jgi:hypothetical protein
MMAASRSVVPGLAVRTLFVIKSRQRSRVLTLAPVSDIVQIPNLLFWNPVLNKAREVFLAADESK